MSGKKEMWKNPGCEYRGVPMWSWNGRLLPEVLRKQQDTFRKMGFGGAQIHSRIGLETPYLGREFMDRVRECVAYAKENGTKIWLYDEDKWPSGFGAGRVTAGRGELACRYLLFSPNAYPDGFHDRQKVFTTRINGNGELRLLGIFRVRLRDGRLAGYECVPDAGPGHRESGSPPSVRDGRENRGETLWYLYLCVTAPSSWFNNAQYGDVLNPDAVKRFLETAYEPYAKAVGEEFGKTIPAIFTDEPCFYRMENLKDADRPEEIGLPYTDALGKLYEETYGEKFLEKIPEIVWEWEDAGISPVRYRYHLCLSRLFTKSYGGQIKAWCREHGILFTGHLLGENTLEEMTRSTGEIMSTLSQWDIPGCDMLANRHEYTTVKQAQSVARQLGKPGVLCEIYGVTNWDFDFRGHKHMGDWLAALGVTVRIPHLAWMTMKGEAKRDYPSPIDGHAPWHEKYPILEDYYARLRMIMESGKPVAHIAVVHPSESCWMQLGPDSTTQEARQRLEEQYQELAGWLLFGLQDFDYVSEELLSAYGSVGKDGFGAGEMRYDAVVVPPLCTIRSSTLALLDSFAAQGGSVFLLGEPPACVDGVRREIPKEVLSGFRRLGFDKEALLDTLEPFREVDVRTAGGERTGRILYQMRREQEKRWLFLAHGKEDTGLEYNLWSEAGEGEELTVSIRGLWSAQAVNCETARAERVKAEYTKTHTCLTVRLHEQDSLLLLLEPAGAPAREQGARPGDEKKQTASLPAFLENYREAVEYSLAEPNVFLLDQAEYALDGGEWRAAEEMLRIDDRIREELGYPLRSDAMAQPWVRKPCRESHTVRLRFVIPSLIEGCRAVPALENPRAKLWWNGKEIPGAEEGGYYVDRAIRCREPVTLKKGENILELTVPFGPDTDLEWCYLLGDFGVYFQNGKPVIAGKPAKVGFFDLTRQGFPFYGGNLTYRIPVKARGSALFLQVPEYRAALLSASLDGEQARDFYKAPYRVRFDTEPGKEYEIALTAYGNRYNTFGQLHDCNRKEEYYGPKTWRTKGKNWSYSYQIRPSGVLVPPVIQW